MVRAEPGIPASDQEVSGGHDGRPHRGHPYGQVRNVVSGIGSDCLNSAHDGSTDWQSQGLLKLSAYTYFPLSSLRREEAVP